jgi:ATP-binding cassette subfamily F protein 3
MTAKVLTPEEQWAATDFSNRDDVIKLFPNYVQEQYTITKNRVKGITKGVNIELFTLKTPFADQTLLVDTSLIIEPGKRQCLYGPNSSGKTLLMTNMAEGKMKDFPKHLHVHHCRELEPHELGDTVLNTVVLCNPYLNMLKKVEAKLTALLTEGAEKDEKKVNDMQENLNYFKMAINTIRGNDAEDRASKMLRVLGFDDLGQKKLVSELSGGLRMRVALCMAFFIDADLLLLDEPTNHLDFPSVLWLENRLRGYRGSFLLVSHDRELLNNVCTGVALLEDKQIKYYSCGFKEFEKKKALEDKKRNEEVDKFLEKNRNADPSTPIGRKTR